jgi:hypothetical protein
MVGTIHSRSGLAAVELPVVVLDIPDVLGEAVDEDLPVAGATGNARRLPIVVESVLDFLPRVDHGGDGTRTVAGGSRSIDSARFVAT